MTATTTTDSSPENQSVMDAEKRSRSRGESDETDETRNGDVIEKTYEPLNCTNCNDRSRNLTVQRTHSRTERSLERSWSINDGYSFHGAEEQEREVEEAKDVAPPPDEFTVGWEENDPMNPRNLSTGRRWFIVFIVSMGSICV